MTLGETLAQARSRRGWSLREVERRTGIHNAHLSQIENGVIERPDPNILWSLAETYSLDFAELMRLAGHTERDDRKARRSLLGVALKTLGELTPEEQQEALRYMEQIRQARKARDA